MVHNIHYVVVLFVSSLKLLLYFFFVLHLFRIRVCLKMLDGLKLTGTRLMP